MSALGQVLFGLAILGSLVVLAATGLLVSMFLDSAASSDRVTGVVIGVIGLVYALLPGLGWWLAHRADKPTAALALWGGQVALDVVAVVVLVIAIGAAARP